MLPLSARLSLYTTRCERSPRSSCVVTLNLRLELSCADSWRVIASAATRVLVVTRTNFLAFIDSSFPEVGLDPPTAARNIVEKKFQVAMIHRETCSRSFECRNQSPETFAHP